MEVLKVAPVTEDGVSGNKLFRFLSQKFHELATAENVVVCTIFKRPNHPEIALGSNSVTEQPKANTEAVEGKKEVAGGSGDKNEVVDADGGDSDGDAEEEEEGGCHSCCHKANSLPIKLTYGFLALWWIL